MARQVAVHFDRHHPLLLSRQAPRIGDTEAASPSSDTSITWPIRWTTKGAFATSSIAKSLSTLLFTWTMNSWTSTPLRGVDCNFTTSIPATLVRRRTWNPSKLTPGNPSWSSSNLSCNTVAILVATESLRTQHDASFVSYNHCAGRLRLLSQSPHLEHRNLQIGHGVFTQVAQLRIARHRHRLHGGNSLATSLQRAAFCEEAAVLQQQGHRLRLEPGHPLHCQLQIKKHTSAHHPNNSQIKMLKPSAAHCWSSVWFPLIFPSTT